MTTTIHLRISREDKQKIEAYAKKLNISTAEYIRRTLADPAFATDGTLKQELASALCRHAQLINNWDSLSPTELAQWEGSLWQLIQ